MTDEVLEALKYIEDMKYDANEKLFGQIFIAVVYFLKQSLTEDELKNLKHIRILHVLQKYLSQGFKTSKKENILKCDELLK